MFDEGREVRPLGIGHDLTPFARGSPSVGVSCSSSASATHGVAGSSHARIELAMHRIADGDRCPLLGYILPRPSRVPSRRRLLNGSPPVSLNKIYLVGLRDFRDESKSEATRRSRSVCSYLNVSHSTAFVGWQLGANIVHLPIAAEYCS